MRKVITLFISLLCAGAVWGQQVRIACIGDSITWGAGLEDRFSQSYPVVLGNLMGQGVVTRNFGFNGRIASSEGDYPYMLENKYDTVKMWLPDVVTIMLGTNDSKPHNWNPEKFEEGYLAMIDDLRGIESHPKIVLITPAPAGDNRHAIRDSVIRDEVIPAIHAIARKRHLPVIDMYTPFEDARDLFPDNVHPGVEGSRRIAEVLMGELQKRPRLLKVRRQSSGRVFVGVGAGVAF